MKSPKKKKSKFEAFADKLNATLRGQSGVSTPIWNELFELSVNAAAPVRQLKRIIFERLQAHNATCDAADRVLATSARHLRLRNVELGGTRGKVLRDDDSIRKSLGRLLKDR